MRTLLLLLTALFISACSNTYFKEASTSKPHAVIVFEAQKGVMGSTILGGLTTVYPLEINGLPPNEWNKWSFKSFKVNPGRLSMFVEAPISSRLIASTYIKFNAVAGERYTITSRQQERHVKISVKNKSGKLVTSSLATKSPVSNTPTYIPIYIP